MSKIINVAAYVLLITCMVTLAYAPDPTPVTPASNETKPKEDPITALGGKIDKLIESRDADSKKLEEIATHLDKIEQLIRTRRP